ncbi:MAG TPA: methyltransferase domain-containing protein [Gemmatimonadota bacterium]|nr:methyltransferase domain-containing protein [Gemmatimonadota bacterium]
MRRKIAAELMDQRAPEPERLSESLRDLAWYNRHFGGTTSIVRPLRRLLDGRRSAELRVLDVGAGGADILVSMARWLGRRSVELHGVAIDAGKETAKLARTLVSQQRPHSVGVVCGDARALPFGDQHFDVTVCSTFLHHLETRDAVSALREMARVSGLGVVVSDLRRGIPGYLASVGLASTVWAGHRYTRHDAPASVRAAFDLTEARNLARAAGLDAEVERQPLFRWSLIWKRS